MKLSLSCCGSGTAHPKDALEARVDQNEIGRLYDRLAGMYDAWGRLTESRARDRALELAQIKDGQSILEVAVGTGLAFSEIVKRNPHGANVGIDLSPGMLEKAKKRLQKRSGANFTLGVGTAFDIHLESGSRDLVMNNYMFDLLPFEDMDRVLHEFSRVLKKNGRLVLVNMTKGERFGSRLYDLVYRLSPRAMGGCRGVRLSDKLKQHGFKIELREYHQQMLFPSEVILAYKQ